MSDGKNQTQNEYYVAKGEENLGPWTIEELLKRVATSEISVTDFVFDDGRGDWIPLMECEAFRVQLNAAKAKPKAPPPKAKAKSSRSLKMAPKEASPESLKAAPSALPEQASMPPPQMQAQAQSQAQTAGKVDQCEWFVQKGAHRYGPFSYFGLVRALQEKTVYEFDFIWKEGMTNWIRIAEHDEFQPDRIRELAGRITGTDVFFTRRHPRVNFTSEVIIHDDRSVWMGQAFEASAGGSGLVIENSALAPGQVVRLHFAPCNGLPAFNALGEIVGKKFSKEVRGSKSPVKYAVRFLKLDGSAEPQVREYFESQVRENAS